MEWRRNQKEVSMRIAVIGGVASTLVLINKLNEHEFKDVKIWSYNPKNLTNVSRWIDLNHVAKKYSYQSLNFTKVQECFVSLKEYQPDYLFVVGLSQIIPREILEISNYGSIGFHPTALPKGRGRAPIAWLLMEEVKGAATFFFLESAIDSGPIIEQIKFSVTDNDDAESVTEKMLEAEKQALDSLLPVIKKYKIKSKKQDFESASWFGKRSPEDGLIDWSEDAIKIDKLIRASTYPHPGAFTFYGKEKLIILKVEKTNAPIKGVIGRILHVDNKSSSFIVQTGDGLLKVKKWDLIKWVPKIGMRLGYNSQVEINKLYEENVQLRSYLQKLEIKISSLEKLIKLKFPN